MEIAWLCYLFYYYAITNINWSILCKTSTITTDMTFARIIRVTISYATIFAPSISTIRKIIITKTWANIITTMRQLSLSILQPSLLPSTLSVSWPLHHHSWKTIAITIWSITPNTTISDPIIKSKFTCGTVSNQWTEDVFFSCLIIFVIFYFKLNGSALTIPSWH